MNLTIHTGKRPGLWLFTLLACGLLLASPTQKSSAQDKEGDRAKALQRELDLNQEEMIKLLQLNREEMRRAMARLGAPVASRPAVLGSSTATSVARDYRLGVLFGLPHPVLVDQLKLEKGQGLVIVEVTASSAAFKAGLKANDILLELNGKKVPSNFAAYGAIVREAPTDKEVGGVVLRQGVRQNFKVLVPNVVLVPVPVADCPSGICPTPRIVPASLHPYFPPIQPLLPPAVVPPVKEKL